MRNIIPLNFFRILSPYYRLRKPSFFLFGHGVIDKKKSNALIQDLHIEMVHFKQMIELWEKMGFVFLSMEEAMEVVLNGKKIQHPWIHLTFDDGYKNNYTVLYPYLSSKNIPFTIFLSTRNIIEHKRFDNYNIYCALTHCQDKVKRQELLQPYAKLLRSNKDINAEIISMVKLFKYFKVDEKEAFLLKVESLLSNDEWLCYNSLYDTEEVLSIEEIKIMAKDPLVYFGSHGYNHYILSTLNNEQINFEQLESQKFIQQITGKIPVVYCYPNGRVKVDYPSNIIELSMKNNFKIGFTTEKKRFTEGINPFLLPRQALSFNYLPKLFLNIL